MPTREVAASAETGHATTIIQGMLVGMFIAPLQL